jgi:DNA-binding beta-propeller fold protein YncE
MASAPPETQAAIVKVNSWGSGGHREGQFSAAQGIALDEAGHVYVSEGGNARVQKFTSEGEFVLMWGWGVRTGAERLEVCRSGCRQGLEGLGNGQLRGPAGMQTTPDGEIYVADASNNRIEVFSQTGGFIRKWGRLGRANGEFGNPADPFCDNGPNDVELDPMGRVYAADFCNLRIQKFTATGGFLDKWPSSYAVALADDAAGNIYVADYFGNRVIKFSSRGEFLRMWGWGVRNGADEFQICTKPWGSCKAGIQGGQEGQFQAPQGIAVGPDGNIYVADTDNHRIEKFSPTGRFITDWRVWRRRDGGLPIFTGPIVVDERNHVYFIGGPGVIEYAQVPPETRITDATIKRRRARAKFEFESSDPGSTFKCKRDHKQFRRCESPKVYRDLKRGEHTFKVKAIDGHRLVDPTPAKREFRIKR